MKSTPTLRFSTKRLVLLTLVSFVAVAALLGIAASANKANRIAKAGKAEAAAATSAVVRSSSAPQSRSAQQAPNAPTAISIQASMVDAFPVHPSGKANPGDVITYTATITNSGSTDATGLVFNDMIDPNTTFEAGSEVASAVALNDIYPQTLVGNVSVDSSIITFSSAANDFLGANPAATISAFDATSANGGTVTMTTSGAGIGQFTYDPPAGFEGTDTFTYTLSDQAGNPSPLASRKGTISLTISGMVWFINSNAGACASGCDGRLSHPFTTLASFQAVNDGLGNHPVDGEHIFIYESATAYVGPVTLRSNQKLIGQDATASLATITGLTPPSSSPAFPAVNSGNATIAKITSAGNAINLTSAATTNLIRGLTVGNTTGIGINGTTFGTLTVADVDISDGAGRTGQALSLTTGTLAATFASILSTNSAATGITLSGVGGSLTTATTSITNPTGIGVSVGTSSATLNFGNTTATTSGGTGVSLLTNTGAITFGSLNISPDANQRGLLATNNTNTLTATSGAITASGAVAVEITRASSSTPLAVSLTSVSANGGASGIILTRTSGNFTVTGNTSGQCGGTVNTSTDPFTITAPVTADCSGGQIQNTTSHGISLTDTVNVSLTRLWLHNNFRSGIDGTLVNGFTFSAGFIEKSGVDNALNPTDGGVGGANISNIAFDDSAAGTENNVFGVVSITNSTFNTGWYHGVNIQNFNGTISNLTISGNSFTSGLLNTQSKGSGIRVIAFGSAATASVVTKATVSGNSVLNFPSDSGIKVTGGNAALGPQAVFGTPGDATNIFSITNNAVRGPSSANPMGSNGIETAMTGTGKAKFSITNNGKPTTRISHFLGIGITCSGGNLAQLVCIIDSNFIDGGDNIFSSRGMAVGSQLGIGQAGTVSASITNNTVSNSAGQGIFAAVTNSNNTANMIIKNNTVGPPRDTDTPAIRVETGSSSGNTAMCLDMTSPGNTAQGSTGGGLGPAPGIGVRRQGSVAGVNTFGIVGLSPSPATAIQTETYLTGQNPSSNLGSASFSNSGSPVRAFVISGSNFTSCSAFTVAALHREADETLASVRKASLETIAANDDLFVQHKNTTQAAAQSSTAPVAKTPNKTVAAQRPVSPVNTSSAISKTSRSNQGGRNDVLSHHAVRRYNHAASVQPLALLSGGPIPQLTVGTLPAGKTVSIQFQVKVDVPPQTRQASTQGIVHSTTASFPDVFTDDPAVGGGSDPTATPIDTTITWTGGTSDWNTPGNWTVPGPVISTYAPGVSNPAVNDVVIPNVGTATKYQRDRHRHLQPEHRQWYDADDYQSAHFDDWRLTGRRPDARWHHQRRQPESRYRHARHQQRRRHRQPVVNERGDSAERINRNPKQQPASGRACS